MSGSELAWRSLHDLGLAGWYGDLPSGAGLLVWNKGRLAGQRVGVMTSTAAKTAVTAGAMGLTLLAWRNRVRAAELQRSSGADRDDTSEAALAQRPRESARGLLANLAGVKA